MKTFKKLTLLPALFALCFYTVNAQCPTASSPNIHVVQKGETLYRIAKNNGLTVEELAQYNNINRLDHLSVCQELKLTRGTVHAGTEDHRPTVLPAEAPTNKTHVIQPGESIAGIAYMYGYTEERFRRFNRLRQHEKAWPGLVLKTSDCDCETANNGGQPVVSTDAGPAPTAPEVPATEVRPYTPSTSTWTTSSPSSGGSFEEDPFGVEEPRRYTGGGTNTSVTAYNQGSTDGRINTAAQPGQRPNVTPPKREFMPADEVVAGNKTSPSNITNPTNSQGKKEEAKPSAASTGPVTSESAPYMNADEIKMVQEINLVRSNPKGYIPFIEAYKQRIIERKAFGSPEVCDELIAELRKTPKLSVLQPLECIFRAAKKHGEDQRPTGDVDHEGTDGRYPWDRVRSECPNLKDGGENIVAGPTDIRDLVILLLNDDGIANRGHRRTMLDPSWNYVAVYKVGEVPGKRTKNWYIQKFGK